MRVVSILLSIIILNCQYFTIFASQRNDNPAVKNIILLIGDGMGTSQMYAGLTANNGSLNIERCTYVGLCQTYSANNYITDSAAAGTAIACGVKTNNGTIGMDTNNTPVKSILQYAVENGLSTGIVVSCDVTHATPASFIAHQPKRSMVEEIAEDFLKTDFTVLIGGGRKNFEDRSDKVNLTDRLKKKGYEVVYNMNSIKESNAEKLVAFLADVHLAAYPKRGEALPESVGKAIDILKNNEKGFFLMVEGSLIDSEGHRNNTEGIINEVLDFDRAVKVALDYAETDPHTLIIITADHETGGMGLNGGNVVKGEVKAEFTTKGHTAVPVPIYTFGAGAQKFTGIYQNTDIFHKCLTLFGFDK
ncbi:alkaline phosphatase [Proteiniphilum acetatigenes]|uniref:alkaline phosphatase n=1 Tax=Proteiniphilum acetatigenes TaxID=294710 RepID=UPI00036B19C7|nr:alkaline phosphatase [Proteiniphilum acetatigenes]